MDWIYITKDDYDPETESSGEKIEIKALIDLVNITLEWA